MILWIFPLTVAAGLLLLAYLRDRGDQQALAVENALVPVRPEIGLVRRPISDHGGVSTSGLVQHQPRSCQTP